MSIGSRLREERERLHLSQADFAERAGVHRNTLVRYEADKRELGTGFIETLRGMGVDVDYVLFGLPDPGAPVECPFLGPDFQRSDGTQLTLAECRHHATVVPTSSSHAVRWWKACQACPRNPVLHGPKVVPSAADIDGPLLSVILEGVEAASTKVSGELSAAKKASVIVMLYRAFKASGKVDLKMIDEAVTLAVS